MSQMQPEEFPILCETCLGENPYLRMTRERYGKACKICDRPFTVYRWRPGPRARFKKTEVCPTCARLKNVCQTCILDLQYGLPVQVRDTAIAEGDKTELLSTMPVSITNRDYLYEQLETETGLGREGGLALPYDKVGQNKSLSRMQRKGPYYKRNLPHICSFYVKGTCTRGDACPYRHEQPVTGELADQNIKDRFYGVNDPVAKKMLERQDEYKTKGGPSSKRDPPKPPADVTIRTLWIGSVDYSITEDHLQETFKEYGSLTSIHVLHEKNCAFITYASRNHAELAVASLYDCLYVNSKRLKLDWGRSKKLIDPAATSDATAATDSTLATEQDASSTSAAAVPPPPAMTKEDEEYLASQGILRPELPPMPDPVVAAAPPGVPTAYQTMDTNYASASFANAQENAENNNEKEES